MKQEDPLYIGIVEPIEMRKDILNSSKSIIRCLKNHERLKIIREEKENAAYQLKVVLREIKILDKKLREIMPKTSIKPRQREIEFEEEPMTMPRIAAEKGRLAQLEDELAKVDERLRDME